MHYAKTVEEFNGLRDTFLRWATVKCPGLATYFREMWFDDTFGKMWSRAFVPQLGDLVSFVNNYIESWHKLLKVTSLLLFPFTSPLTDIPFITP